MVPVRPALPPVRPKAHPPSASPKPTRHASRAKAFRGGVAGAAAMVINVTTLM